MSLQQVYLWILRVSTIFHLYYINILYYRNYRMHNQRNYSLECSLGSITTGGSTISFSSLFSFSSSISILKMVSSDSSFGIVNLRQSLSIVALVAS
mmetsp:Transcript_5350/g.6144  ORF Transcript_5350/g.6144 Transcript_5350/m.6144 type:complete len:96 (-) Transcript_5350:2679-2966(-)